MIYDTRRGRQRQKLALVAFEIEGSHVLVTTSRDPVPRLEGLTGGSSV